MSAPVAVRELARKIREMHLHFLVDPRSVPDIERLIAQAVGPLVNVADEARRDFELNDRRMMHSTKASLDKELARWGSV